MADISEIEDTIDEIGRRLELQYPVERDILLFAAEQGLCPDCKKIILALARGRA